ncbi:hypothetical protein [Tsukamurella paurometabola]|uniref:Glycosyltransferase RgtA/B/C/D-like domain-containing protein n=1 Tax=Tsukamurella paurometabola TaxID=2061 RepID=A0A3P8JZV6_TSUPA|nr:hypothetical protein [Tsukamurella paurometabola]UEA81353.1 hypothetical protein LK411_13115 [Tsukamurella paurometabola]VDR38334.1 Uncharacterised protein [Tsukamurella paurometabola]
MSVLRRSPVLTGVAITAGAMLLYLLTLAREYLGDGIQFAMIAENGSAADLLVPNHLLYPLIPAIFYRAWQLFGWTGGALLPLQVASAIGGAAAVGLTYILARRITASTPLAAIVASGFALSFGIWRYSISADSVTIPLVFALLVLLTLIPRDPTTGPRPLLTAAACTGAILAYQTQALLLIVVIVAYLTETKRPRAQRIRDALRTTTIVASASATVYLAVAVGVASVRSVGQLLEWQFAMADTGLWGNPSPHSIIDGAQAMVSAIGAPIAPLSSDRATAPGKVAFVGIAIIAAAPLVGAIAVRKDLLSGHRRTVSVLATWAVAFGAFTLYWVAADISFWAPALVPWWLFTGLVLALLAVRARPRTRVVSAAAVAAVVAIAAHGWGEGIAPAQFRSTAYRTALAIGDRTDPHDLIVTTGGDDLFLQVPYFAERRTFSVLHHLLGVREAPSPWIIDPTTVGYSGGRPTAQEVFAVLDREIERTCASGGRAYLVGSSQRAEWEGIAELAVAPNDFERYPARSAWREGVTDVREVVGGACNVR